LGVPQKIENQSEFSDIEKREGFGGSKSEAPRVRGGGNRKNRKDSQRCSDGPQKWTKLDLDPMNECLRTGSEY
jgi:hypothetical protein